MRLRRVSLLCVITAFLALHGVSLAQPTGTSVGNTRRGRLIEGIAFPATGEGFRFETNRGNLEARYGTPSLVRMLQASIARVNAAAPGGQLIVEDISNRHGGTLPGHGSHTSGRDADVRFYAVDASGQPMEPRRVSYGPDGRAVDGGPERFDVERNWLLIEAMLQSREVRVRFIFVAPWIEHLLLAHARPRAPRELLRLAERRMRPPGTPLASPHDDHLHVRIGCPAGDVAHGCRP